MCDCRIRGNTTIKHIYKNCYFFIVKIEMWQKCTKDYASHRGSDLVQLKKREGVIICVI